MAGNLTFSAEATIAAAQSGDLPGNEISMLLALKDGLKLIVEAYQHGLKSVSGDYAALPMGAVANARFVALQTDGENAVTVKLNGGDDVLTINGFFAIQADSSAPVTSIEVASAGASIEYLLVQ